MYNGQVIRIPMGQAGLNSDDNQSAVPFQALILANNVTLREGIIEKSPGSRRWNVTPLSSGVVAASDFWPTDITQRLIVVTRDGRIIKYLDPQTPVVLKSGLTITDPPKLVTGGAESAMRNRKLFVITGNNPIQVISGDATSTYSLTKPTSDWSSSGSADPTSGTISWPTNALIHHNRLVAFGNLSSPHTFYMSDPADHENFQTNTFQFQVFPGEGEALFAGYSFKGRLFLGKYPEGAYYLDDSDPDFVNWSVHKLTNIFGAASRHSFLEAANDLLIANSFGTVTSGTASNSLLGSLEMADVLVQMRVARFQRENMSQDGRKDRQVAWYGFRSQAYFTYRSSSGVHADRIMTLDMSNAQMPKITWGDKDQPNCLFMRKDSLRILRPFYGAEDGYIYEMDRPDRDVGGAAFTGEFQTPHLDFGFADPGMAEKLKLFDFLEVTFEDAGNWPLSVDVYIDKEFIETIDFTMNRNSALDDFTLDEDDVVGRAPGSFRMPLHGSGRRISFHAYNSGLRQTFKIVALTVYFRLAADNQGAGSK